MFQNLHHLSKEIGGFGKVISSPYFLLSIATTAGIALTQSIGRWADISLATLPSLTGFSIASFAIVFAVADRATLIKLASKSKDEPSLLMEIISIFIYALIVQVGCLIFASVFSQLASSKLAPSTLNFLCLDAESLGDIFSWAKYLVSVAGTFMLTYSLFLLIAVALSVFRLIEIITSSIR